jgi:drug/metabolite transporter (DMT)-like permease
MALAIFAGVAFGAYFVALKMANPLGLVMPMAIARTSSVVLCGLVLGVMALVGWKDTGGTKWWAGWGWACGVALLDTGGNVLFMEATRLGRLDVASVLASLYPAGTILLAAWYLHERPTRRQMLGMVAALAAVVMITL